MGEKLYRYGREREGKRVAQMPNESSQFFFSIRRASATPSKAFCLCARVSIFVGKFRKVESGSYDRMGQRAMITGMDIVPIYRAGKVECARVLW